MVRIGISLVSTLALASLTSSVAWAQAQALPPITVNLPPSPNFNVATAPVEYPTGELSVFGLRKNLTKNLDKDFKVKAYLLQVYECPAEIRKCNEELDRKLKGEKKKAAKKGEPPPEAAAGDKPCRACDQPHFFIADTPTTKIERALLVADYPIKDWKTGKPKPLTAKTQEQYIITGTFAINSMTGFGASNGLIIHKKMEDLQGNVILEGNAVLPPEAMQGAEGQPVPGKAIPK